MTSPLPPLYASWIDALLDGPLPDETDATCGACPMLPKPGEAPAAGHFDPRTKCCTYLPALPNYLVGRILADDDPDFAEGRQTLVQRLRAGAEVSPLGIGRPRPHVTLYEAAPEAFGHARSLRCPHYLDRDGGRCGLWRHRNAICATWYCKHVRGAVGMQLWRSVHRLLYACERALSTWLVLELDPGPEALDRLFPVHPGAGGEPPILGHELDGLRGPDYRVVWGRFAERELEFYRACAERVAGLSWPDVLARSGPEVRAAAHLLRLAYDAHRSKALPEAVKLGPFLVMSSDADLMRVQSYSPYDLLELPRALADVLHRFDGRPLADVLETMETGDNVSLDGELVRRLLDYQILQEA